MSLPLKERPSRSRSNDSEHKENDGSSREEKAMTMRVEVNNNSKLDDRSKYGRNLFSWNLGIGQLRGTLRRNPTKLPMRKGMYN